MRLRTVLTRTPKFAIYLQVIYTVTDIVIVFLYIAGLTITPSFSYDAAPNSETKTLVRTVSQFGEASTKETEK